MFRLCSMPIRELHEHLSGTNTADGVCFLVFFLTLMLMMNLKGLSKSWPLEITVWVWDALIAYLFYTQCQRTERVSLKKMSYNRVGNRTDGVRTQCARARARARAHVTCPNPQLHTVCAINLAMISCMLSALIVYYECDLSTSLACTGPDCSEDDDESKAVDDYYYVGANSTFSAILAVVVGMCEIYQIQKTVLVFTIEWRDLDDSEMLAPLVTEDGPKDNCGILGPEHKDTADLFRAQCEARAAGRPIPTATRAAGAAAPADISERASRVATSDYSSLSITELKQRLDDLGVPRWDCCEKSALVAKLQQNASNV